MARPRDRRVICHREGDLLPSGWASARYLDWGRHGDAWYALLEIRPMSGRERIRGIYFRPDIDRIGLQRSRLADGGPRRVAL